MAVILHLSCDVRARRVFAEIASGEDEERRNVAPLIRFLRDLPPWLGGDKIEVRVNYPGAIRHAFRPATIILTGEQLEQEAAMVWSHLGEWRNPVPWLAWIAAVRNALSEHFAELSKQHPELRFEDS